MPEKTDKELKVWEELYSLFKQNKKGINRGAFNGYLDCYCDFYGLDGETVYEELQERWIAEGERALFTERGDW